MLPLAIDRDKLADLCRRRHIRKLAVFGSVLHEDFRPDSDVDLLVDFEPGHTPGLAFFTLADELSAIFGRKVDLSTPADLGPYLRGRVLREAEVLYGDA